MAKFLFMTNKGHEFTVTADTMIDAEREFETPDKDGKMLLEPGEKITSRRQVSVGDYAREMRVIDRGW